MVGAHQVGEFAWAMENLLNKVIDNSIIVDSAVMDVTAQAIDVLPLMVGQIRGDSAPDVDVNALAARADALAAGKTPGMGTASELEAESSESAEKKIQKLAPAEEELFAEASSTVDSTVTSPLDSEDIRLVYSEETSQHLERLQSFIQHCRDDQQNCYFQFGV